MGSFTNYTEKLVLNSMCGNGGPLASISMWVGLFTAAPSDASGGTEATGGSYARKTSGAWTSCTAGVDNVATIAFAAASNTWGGTLTHFALLDDSATGNMIVWAALTTSRTVATGDVAVFAVGALDITLD